MSTLKSKFISAPVNGPTVEPLVLQTNNVDRVTISSTGAVTVPGTFGVTGAVTAGSLQVGGISTDLRPLVNDTAKTATGTSVDFTGIPSWAKRITVVANGISTASTGNNFQVQLGSASGVEASSYFQFTGYMNTASGNGNNTASTGFQLAGNWGPSVVHYASLIITNLSGNIWICQGTANSSLGGSWTSGSKTLSAALDRLRITINGTDTFDAGTINILYE